MRVNQISVTKLFGLFDHTIPLNHDERVTIIYGPNGIGKTVLLRMLSNLFKSEYAELRSIPFEEFRVDFDNSCHLCVHKITTSIDLEKNGGENQAELKFNFSDNNGNIEEFSPKYPSPKNDFSLSLLEQEISGLERIGVATWSYAPTNEILTFEDVLDRFGDDLPFIKSLKMRKNPEWFQQLKRTTPIRFIETQRLLKLSPVGKHYVETRQPSKIEAVARYSNELARIIQQKLAESAALSQSLDRTFPGRVFKQADVSVITNDALRNRLGELEEKRSRLMTVGLLDREEEVFQVPQQIDESTKNVLSIYVEDVEQKLGVFDDIAAKIALFTKIINSRFEYKEMIVSKENGFTFTTPNHNMLSPTDLSSGEQHELVLFYELLFETPSDSLILIDEPELSLHVAWQLQFLQDLQAITKLANFDVLLATHSPTIINNRWDLTVALKGPVE